MIVSDFLNSRRRDLVDVLVSAKIETEQTDLLGGSSYESDVNIILDQIARLTSERIPLYTRWTNKINGKSRNIGVPKPLIYRFLKGYVLPLIKSRDAHETCHGSEKGWSTRSSLTTHLPVSSALSFDLRDAFEIFPSEEVYRFFMGFFEGREHADETSRFLTLLTTVSYEHERGLPVGSPIANALFNRVIFPLDEVLSSGAEQRGMKYSRWVDDMIISSPEQRTSRDFLGAVALTDLFQPVAQNKIFFQTNQEDVYLLGHVISSDGRIRKNSEEERIENKVAPLDPEFLLAGKYKPWT